MFFADLKIFIVLTSLEKEVKKNRMVSAVFLSFVILKRNKNVTYTSSAKIKYKNCHSELRSPYAKSWKGMARFLSIPSGSFYSAEINRFS